MSREVCGICWCPYDDDTGACGCKPVAPPEAQTQAEKIAYCAGWWDALAKARGSEERNFCPRCGKRTNDIHTCTPPHEERFCDTHCTWADHAPGCVRAEPVQEPVRGSEMRRCPRCWEPMFPPHPKPLTEEEIDELSRTMVKGDRSVNWLCRAIERAHGIGGQP